MSQDALSVDLDEVNMDLESSSSLGIDATDILLSPNSSKKSKSKSPNKNNAIATDAHKNSQSKYPSIRKPPPPPPINNQSISNQNNNNNEQKQSELTYQSSISSLFTSAKNSISRSAKSVSSKTSERISLDGQLKQARIALERLVNPKIANTEINADKSIPKWVLKGAKGIVFLTVVKAGFLVAGSIGTGCVIVRRNNGKWSGPSSIGVGGISAGLLVGASKVDYIMILPNDKAVQQFTGNGQLRLGGELQLAVGPVGRDASGSVGTDSKTFSVVYSYSHAAGLYGGLGLDGKIISVRPKCNEEFYGEKLSVYDILMGKVDSNNIQNTDFEMIIHLLDAYCIDENDEKKLDDSRYGTMNLTAVFGRDINELECTKLKEYKSAIPNVLIALKDALYKYEYHLIEGIFRISGQKSKIKIVKDMINNGNLYDIEFEEIDGIIIGELIKIWFRELPNKIFDKLDYNKIENVETVSDAQIIIDNQMNEPELSYFYWLLDLCIQIGKYSDLNSMSVNNMAIVITPNLYNMENIQSVSINNSMVQFVSLCITLRNDMKHLNNANKIMDEVEQNNNNQQVYTAKKPDIPL